jgi:SAM-dependent methyltransferase
MDPSEWDERYQAKAMLWSRGPNSFVESRLRDAEPGVGLDLACGEGRNAIWLATKGWDMTGVDFSEVAIERGRVLSKDVEFVHEDVFVWEPHRPFDLILIAYLQVEADPLSELVARAANWLEPGGELFMVGHDLSNLDEGVGGPQVPERLWDLNVMLEWIQGLRVVEAGVVERPVEVDGEVRHARDTLIRARAAEKAG